MIFDDSDLNNPNWKYYDVIKNDKLWNYYKTRKQLKLSETDGDFNYNLESVSPISTDSIRIRLLRVIPNALYMDSDAYLNITSKEFLELCNKYGDTDILISDHFIDNKNKTSFVFTGYFAGAKSEFLDDIIEYYNYKHSMTADDFYAVKTVYNDKKYNIFFLPPFNNYVYHLFFSNFRHIYHYPKDLQLGRIFIKNVVKYHDLKTKNADNYNPLKYIIRCNNLEKINRHLDFIINDDFLWVYNYEVNKFYNDDNNYGYVFMHFVLPLYQEFITKFKETVDKTINFYELEDLGDNPCLLKKI
jgi:hypothetical protein